MPLSNAELIKILYIRLARLNADRKVAASMGDVEAVEAIDAEIVNTNTKISNAGGPPWIPPEGNF